MSRNPGTAAANLEEEADQFAVALLMPEELVRREVAVELAGLDREWLNPVFDGARVKALARRFQVSPAMMSFRLTDLGLLNLKRG